MDCVYKTGIATLLLLLACKAFADEIYFNAETVIHIQDNCTSNKIVQCSDAAYYTYTHLVTGKTYRDIALRIPVSESPDYYSYAYKDDKGQILQFKELSSEPLHSFSSFSFDTNKNDRNQALNTTSLSFIVERGLNKQFNNRGTLWLYRYNSRPNGCGDVISYSLKTGEVLGDGIIFTQVCTFPNMKLQQTYAAYRQILLQSDDTNDLYFSKLRTIFPNQKMLEDKFTTPEWLAIINYNNLTSDQAEIEIFRECGDSHITLKESAEGTEIVHYDYGC